MPFDARSVDPRLRRAMRILENDQSQTPSTAGLAKQVGLSPAHFSRLFAAQIGEASSAYGRRIRLDHSINRLRYDPSSIGEVARDFGYESQAAFTRAFHAQFGASPREYMDRIAAVQPIDRVPLPGSVRVIRRDPTSLAARRFFGDDQVQCLQTFLNELPADLREGAAFVCLLYDDPRVTPSQHQRLDCCFVLRGGWSPAFERAGLDAIALPGGLHGEVAATGQPGELHRLFIALFGEWLPTRPGLAPEGDPLPIFFDEPPVGLAVRARVAIRVRERASFHSPNAGLLHPDCSLKKSSSTEPS